MDGLDFGVVFGVVSNSLRIIEDFVYVFWGDIDDVVLFNNFGVFLDIFFNIEYFFNNECRLDIFNDV